MFMIPTLAHRPPLSLELSTAADNLIRLIGCGMLLATVLVWTTVLPVTARNESSQLPHRARRSYGPVSARSHGKTTPRPRRPGSPSCAHRGRRLRQISACVMGPDFAQLAANLGRNFIEGRLGILTAVFEAAGIDT